MKNFYFFLLVIFFASCKQMQTEPENSTNNKLYNPEEQLKKKEFHYLKFQPLLQIMLKL